ncbi:GFA family protein [Idiomarina loihiensis]|uniref:GFA family protein n=1 Tax=Idiomarina loihiensis TaxID=135577 RepID=UPI00129C7000|nr:GFA family protein [Idiomarina loihiensis]MRJ44588.1 aldehyde-activating protein [Idiomarina loihiensis]UTW32386.1 GFA family protein [Idiomarina loihiensis]
MYQGSCLCGVVTIEVHGGIDSIIHCHCSMCRKSSGTAYATNGFVAKAGLLIKTGEEQINYYEIAPGKKRHFCRVCASPIFSSNDESPELLRLRLGILDTDIVERPISHNFVSSSANWDELDAELPRYDGHEPSRVVNK